MCLAGSSNSDSFFSLNQFILSLVLLRMCLDKLRPSMEGYDNREIVLIINSTRAGTTISSSHKYPKTQKTLNNCSFNSWKSWFNRVYTNFFSYLCLTFLKITQFFADFSPENTYAPPDSSTSNLNKYIKLKLAGVHWKKKLTK